MKPPETIEDVLFNKMGVSVEDALATGMDLVDEKVSQASDEGIDVESRLSGLLGLLVQLTEPENMQAIQTLIQRLPQIAQLAKLVDEFPNLIATFGDVFDDYGRRCEADGINLEDGLINGLQAILWLGSQIDKRDRERLSALFQSEILSKDSISVVANAADALADAQKQSLDSDDRIGLFGLLKALKKPEVQKAIAFAAIFGESFGRKVNSHRS